MCKLNRNVIMLEYILEMYWLGCTLICVLWKCFVDVKKTLLVCGNLPICYCSSGRIAEQVVLSGIMFHCRRSVNFLGTRGRVTVRIAVSALGTHKCDARSRSPRWRRALSMFTLTALNLMLVSIQRKSLFVETGQCIFCIVRFLSKHCRT